MTIIVNPIFNFTYDGAVVNKYHANKGEGLPRHDHFYAHATLCACGSILIRKENLEIVLDKNSDPVNLLPNEWHEIEALEDNTVFINIFSEGKY